MPKKSGFSLQDIMSERSLQKADQEPEIDDMEITIIDIYDLIPSEENFYNMNDIESLKRSITRFGLLQPILVKPDRGDGKYDITAGHRRRLACLSLVEEDNMEKYRYVPCVIKNDGEEETEEKEIDALLNRLELMDANLFREKTEWERMEEALQQVEIIEKLRKKVKMTGRTRSILKEFTEGKVKETQIARYNVIKKNLCHELMEEFKENNIGVIAAYDAARLSTDYQKQAFRILKDQGTLTGEDLKKLKSLEEQKVPEEEESDAGQQDIKGKPEESVEKEIEPMDGNMNPPEEFEPAVDQCDGYTNEEAEKTEEQRYSEEQDKIDRDTRRKLREQADEEKMKELPSDAVTETKHIRVAADTYKRILDGIQSYLILKGEYKTGDTITLLEFANGVATGRVVETKITHMDDAETSTAIAEGYCVINLKTEEIEPCCGTCYWFNGGPDDGEQLCEKLKAYVDAKECPCEKHKPAFEERGNTASD